MREGEILGLGLSNINADSMEITVEQTLRRETETDLMTGEKVEGVKTKIKAGSPKSAKGNRTIPLLPQIVLQLEVHRVRQDLENEKAGAIYVGNYLVFPNVLGESTDA